MLVHPLRAGPGRAEEVQQQQPVHDRSCQGPRSRSRPARRSPAAAARSGAHDAGLGDREHQRRRRRRPEPSAAEARRAAAAAGRRQAAQQQPVCDQVLPGLGQHLRGVSFGSWQISGSTLRLRYQALHGLGSTLPCTTRPCQGLARRSVCTPDQALPGLGPHLAVRPQLLRPSAAAAKAGCGQQVVARRHDGQPVVAHQPAQLAGGRLVHLRRRRP